MRKLAPGVGVEVPLVHDVIVHDVNVIEHLDHHPFWRRQRQWIEL